ncbi:hypothetical protein M3Y97_00299500 [Aphelenchoides bicaudatus]|nr:hypothetical protein M3Y97_00299500 [Aphelenchoides bicaudatus]
MYAADGQARHRRTANGSIDESVSSPNLRVQESKPTESLSFSNLSSLIATPAQQFWSNAQTSIQAIADYTQSVTSDPYPGSVNFSIQSQEKPAEQAIVFDFIIMPNTDRTSEFRTVAKSFQMKMHAQNGRVNNTTDRNKIIQSSIQFNQLAKRIGRDLSITCAKMEKLTELAKKKSLFDDRAGEIDDLSTIIKQDIQGLNSQIANLQQVIKSRQAAAAEQGTNHSKLVVVGLQAKLVSLGNNFKNVQEIRTENLKHKSRRREQFSQSQAVPFGLPPSASTGNMGSVLLRDEAQSSGAGSSVALDMDQIQQQDQMMLIDESETYHKSRFNAVQNIESSITELGQIFNQLSMLVAEQGEMITRLHLILLIDSNVEHTSMNIESAHLELLRYFNNISKNRWLMLKVFGVLMAFFVIFVVFLT